MDPYPFTPNINLTKPSSVKSVTRKHRLPILEAWAKEDAVYLRKNYRRHCIKRGSQCVQQKVGWAQFDSTPPLGAANGRSRSAVFRPGLRCLILWWRRRLLLKIKRVYRTVWISIDMIGMTWHVTSRFALRIGFNNRHTASAFFYPGRWGLFA